MYPDSVQNVFQLDIPEKNKVPVVLDSPHSGTIYPENFGSLTPLAILRRAEDMYVDELYDSASEHGMPFLKALFPRCFIDANRAEEDLDPTMIEGTWDSPLNPGRKSELGIGLIWTKSPPDGEPMYDRKLSIQEVTDRIVLYHRPYHKALKHIIDSTLKEFGFVWHIDCHSMPSISNELSPEGPGVQRPDFNLGDRDGTTCSPGFTAFCKERLERLGYGVTINDPFKGMELVRRYGIPQQKMNSLQIEINRAIYMDESSFEKKSQFIQLQRDLGVFLSELSEWAKMKLGS
jgi:N-formylglutamate deformylase